ncbi:hypothetical protein ACFW1A_36675, partial [Kitasatospora sp. NPDC058965]
RAAAPPGSGAPVGAAGGPTALPSSTPSPAPARPGPSAPSSQGAPPVNHPTSPPPADGRPTAVASPSAATALSGAQPTAPAPASTPRPGISASTVPGASPSVPAVAGNPPGAVVASPGAAAADPAPAPATTDPAADAADPGATTTDPGTTDPSVLGQTDAGGKPVPPVPVPPARTPAQPQPQPPTGTPLIPGQRPSPEATGGPAAVADPGLTGQGSATDPADPARRYTVALTVTRPLTAVEVELRLDRAAAGAGAMTWSTLPGARVTLDQDGPLLVYRFALPAGEDVLPGSYTFTVQQAGGTAPAVRGAAGDWTASGFALDDPSAVAVRGGFGDTVRAAPSTPLLAVRQ